MSIEAMKQALEALELAQDNLRPHGDNCFLHDEGEYNRCFCGKDSLSNFLQEQVESLIQAIAEAEKQEPHSWYSAQEDEWMTNKIRKEHERLNSYTHKVGKFDLALYTHPQPKREWVGLMDDEIEQGCKESWVTLQAWQSAVWWAEAKLKEKNT